MAYGSIPLDKRLKDNIRNYKLTSLYDLDEITEMFKAVNKVTGLDILMTERHGEKIISVGKWADFSVDVVDNPGMKVKVENRTIAHVYANYDMVDSDKLEACKRMVEGIVTILTNLADKAYRTKELEIYADELTSVHEKEIKQAKTGEKNDELTGVLNHTYFENRLKIVDRSQVLPVAAVCVNINDWKYVNDNYGDEESDRLISTIAELVRNESKPDYIIGRVDGDVFNVVIPMPADGEALDYVSRIREACLNYDDPILAPSVAIGLSIKENVETEMSEVFSDAEYNMFEDKIEVKNAPGYRERLTHGKG